MMERLSSAALQSMMPNISDELETEMSPETAGDATPERGQDTVLPVDDADMLVMVDGIEDFLGYGFRFKHHGVVEVAIE